jgi:hypothetical protein
MMASSAATSDPNRLDRPGRLPAHPPMKSPINFLVALASATVFGIPTVGVNAADPSTPRFTSAPALMKARSGMDAAKDGAPGASGKRGSGRRSRGPGRFSLGPSQSHDRRHPGDTDGHPLPTFTRTFEYNGVTYTDRFVGTDPARRPQTTVIHTLIMPLRLDVGGGVVLDPSTDAVGGRTPLDWVLHSPVFTNVEYFAKGASFGKHQFADELARENFWSEGGNDPRYHVILDPLVLPVQTVVVTPDRISLADHVIDVTWLDEQANGLMSRLNPDPATLVIIVAGYGLSGDGGAAAYHNAATLASRPNGPLQSYIVTLWTNDWSDGLYDPEIGINVGHEVAEWLNDPFTDNEVPPWAFYGSYGMGILEVADPFEFEQNDTDIYALTTVEGTAYVMPDVAYYDWFTRRPVSRSLNGYYSFNTQATFSEPTYDMSRYEVRQFDVPNSISTILTGISSRGDLTGYFADQNGVEHGMLVIEGKIRRFDLPGATATYPRMINAGGAVIGTYDDASGSHQFLFKNGKTQAVDPFPDATVDLNSINDAGDIVGTYYPASGLPAAGGLLIHRGVPQKVLPLGAPASAILAISRSGKLAGLLDSDGDYYWDYGFTGTPGSFSVVDYAGPAPLALETAVNGISDNGNIAGTVYDLTGANNGFYRNQGVWDRIGYGHSTFINNMNEDGVAVGYATPYYSPYHGIIVLPKKVH